MGFGRLSEFVACFIFVSFLVGVLFSALLNRWNCPAINYKLAAGDGGSSVRCEKSYKLCNLIRPVWATQGNTPKHFHEFLPGHCVVAFVFVRHALNHSRGGIGFNEAGG